MNTLCLLRDFVTTTDILPVGWINVPVSSDQQLKLCYFDAKSDAIVPKVAVIVNEALEYIVLINGRNSVIPFTWKMCNKISDRRVFKTLLEKLSNAFTCHGNNDSQYIQFCNHRKGILQDKSGISLIIIVSIVSD